MLPNPISTQLDVGIVDPSDYLAHAWVLIKKIAHLGPNRLLKKCSLDQTTLTSKVCNSKIHSESLKRGFIPKDKKTVISGN